MNVFIVCFTASLLFVQVFALRNSMASTFATRVVTSHQSGSGGKTYALLVAGSKGYMNYRHQADVCHAYQILNSHGFPSSQIVTMLYDDVAHSWQNPHRGQLFNEPGGPDVYSGMQKNYTGLQVTPKNFLKALQSFGSTKDDRIFVYFADHGGGGVISFPSIIPFLPANLHEQDLENTIKTMHTNGQYGQMTMYIEACFSGSMFNQWLGKGDDSFNLYVVTAATPFESSYACYPDKRAKTWIGDCFSNHWMEDADNNTQHFADHTLEDQFSNVFQKTTNSTPCQYGSLDIAKLPIGDFQGTDAKQPMLMEVVNHPQVNRDGKRVHPEDMDLEMALAFGTDSDVAREKAKRDHVDKTIQSLVAAITEEDTPTQCQGQANELLCYTTCMLESKETGSDACAKLCCGESPDFFPSECMSSGPGAERCFIDCCKNTGEGTGIEEVCNPYNATHAQFRPKCEAQCCGANICITKGKNTLSKSLHAKRTQITQCYKDMIHTVAHACQDFFTIDYTMIKYSHILRTMCAGGVDPNGIDTKKRIHDVCRK